MHVRYTGPVIDTHCHYDATTVAMALGVADIGGLTSAIHLCDWPWPPTSFSEDAATWESVAPRIRRCHSPDLSRVGDRAFGVTAEREMRQAVSGGAVGLKIWKNLGLWECDVNRRRLTIDDHRLAPMWNAAADIGLPVVIHVGDPPAFFAPLTDDNPRVRELQIHPDWWWGAPQYPSLPEIHDQFESLVSRYPDTQFIAAHFGCFMDWMEVARMLASYPNYNVDTAAAIADMGHVPDSPVRDTIIRFSDRVLFGTDLIRTAAWDMPTLQQRWDLSEFFDMHWRFFETGDIIEHPLPDQGEWQVTGLNLPSDVLARLYYKNAAQLFALDPAVLSNEVASRP